MSTFLYQTGRSYYYYKGSLTTPPCTETVDWHVMEGAIRITEADVSTYNSVTSVVEFCGRESTGGRF